MKAKALKTVVVLEDGKFITKLPGSVFEQPESVILELSALSAVEALPDVPSSAQETATQTSVAKSTKKSAKTDLDMAIDAVQRDADGI